MIIEKDGSLSVDVSVKPGGSRDRLEWDGTVLTIRTRAKPVEGKANAAVIEILAETMDLPKSRISLEKGEKSRQKRFSLTGIGSEYFYGKMKDIHK